ncbi:S-adenosyl-L-methionine-dependent methyltransferase [Aspergillus alliaceus]|uniref:S-adenosyl-L-methionine-dependent methyltransferase n=1 Tax=Petromyces alliaceus TaxID=209559 RepID=A0A5N7CAV3_PETAA|nr:S-adenosyl-L-methionine-dependent methyltransferase [Aspergillus alliaceus]
MGQFTDLAKIVEKETQHISSYCKAENIPEPSFDARVSSDGQASVENEELTAARRNLFQAATDLAILALGPAEHLRWQSWNQFNDNISLQAIIRFHIAESVPQEGITFLKLSEATGVDLRLLSRILRHAMTSHIFYEPEPGVVAHTASSKALSNNQQVRNWLDMTLEEWGPAALRTVDAFQKYPRSEEQNESGFGLAFNGQTIFEFLAKQPERSKVFGGAMANFSAGESHKIEHFVHGYDWKALGNGTVVDIGGSHGHISTAIAAKAPDLKFVVQDLSGTAADGAKMLDPAFKNRVTFMAHDMNDVQPVLGAQAYIFRSVLLNWPRKYCVKFLKNLVPAMTPGARVIINEGLLPEQEKLSAWDDRILRSLDLCMMGMFNSNERTVEEWKEIIAEADSRFRLLNVNRPNPASLLWILEIIWE